MKNDTKITLTLKQIKKLVKESAGTGKWWMDIPGAQYLWHGEWSDPEIIYKGFSLNYWDVEEGALDMYREEHPEDKEDKGFDEYFKTLGGDGGYLHGELEDLVYALLGDNGLDRKPWLGIKDANLVKELGGKPDGEHVVYKGCLVDLSDLDYWDEEYGEFTSYSDDPKAFCKYYRGPMHRQELVDQLDKAVSQFVSESVKEDSFDVEDDPTADPDKPEEKVKKWYGDTKCDFCHRDCGKTLYDGMTGMGPWAVMCEPCFHEYGVGLGLGKGQKYKKVGDEYIQVDDKRKSAAKKRASRRRDVSDWEREFFPELFSEGRKSKVTFGQLKRLVKEEMEDSIEDKMKRYMKNSDAMRYHQGFYPMQSVVDMYKEWKSKKLSIVPLSVFMTELQEAWRSPKGWTKLKREVLPDSLIDDYRAAQTLEIIIKSELTRDFEIAEIDKDHKRISLTGDTGTNLLGSLS